MSAFASGCRARAGALALMAVAATLAACGGDDAPATSLDHLDAAQAAAACAQLGAEARLHDTTLQTSYVPAGTRRPGNATTGPLMAQGHCKVIGKMDPHTDADGTEFAIGFELSLPDRWNGRFLYLGGGGNDGVLRDTTGSSSISIATPSPLEQGFAVVSTDAGHSGTTAASFGHNERARIDHAWRGHERTASTAKALIQQRYGRAQDYAYFSGCSGGGRQGMMFAQRFADYFDGITAGAPAMRVASGATVAAMWNHQHLMAAAPLVDGQPILAQAFSDTDLALVAQAIRNQCDANDGLIDGLVSHTTACTITPQALQCSGDQTAQCLSAAQVQALDAVFDGPRNSAGQALYVGQPWDPGLADADWRRWTLGTSTTAEPNSRYITLMLDALAHEFFTPPAPGFDAMQFNFDTDPARMQAFSEMYDTYRDAALSHFRQRGGKLLLIHGMADPIFSALDTRDYYQRLVAANGGRASADQFARYFEVPGMAHCSGGPATDAYDSIQAMVDWVEKGIAPDAIMARARPGSSYYPGRSRPLCAWPSYARYNGSGDPEDAASFSCAMP